MDGEPWTQTEPCTIDLSYLSQVLILLPRPPPTKMKGSKHSNKRSVLVSSDVEGGVEDVMDPIEEEEDENEK